MILIDMTYPCMYVNFPRVKDETDIHATQKDKLNKKMDRYTLNTLRPGLLQTIGHLGCCTLFCFYKNNEARLLAKNIRLSRTFMGEFQNCF